jgi:hypothetical protein
VSVLYGDEGAFPSGLPLTLRLRETYSLLDGTVLRQTPLRADLILYRTTDGRPRSHFSLRPIPIQQTLPVSVELENLKPPILRLDDPTTVPSFAVP